MKDKLKQKAALARWAKDKRSKEERAKYFKKIGKLGLQKRYALPPLQKAHQ